jgi:hypothetical protein
MEAKVTPSIGVMETNVAEEVTACLEVMVKDEVATVTKIEVTAPMCTST